MTSDDPRLTAYALNELEEADHMEVEAFLASDETARRTVEETRRTVAMLTESLRTTSAPNLTAAQLETIVAATTPSAIAPSLSDEPARPGRRAWARWALATAACAALAAGGISALHSLHKSNNQNLALNGTGSGATPQRAETKATLATLTERAKNLIRRHQLRQALGVLTQILELNSGDEYARHTYPLVYDEFQRNPGKYTETREREVTNSLNSKTIPDEEILRYPENWPDISIDRNVTRTVPVPDGGILYLGGQTVNASGATVTGSPVHSASSANALTLHSSTPESSGNLGSVRGYKFSQVNARQDSVGFTSSPTTGVPGSIGATGAGSSGGFKSLQISPQNITASEQRAFAGQKADSIYAVNSPDHNSPRWASDSVLIPSGAGWPETSTATTQQQHTATAPNESYAAIHDNPFLPVASDPLSTFSIDVDTGSYSNIRRFLNEGHLPPPDAVRIEEMLNYFPYTYETPKSDSKVPFATTIEIAACPWNMSHRLARVAIKGREIAHDKRPVSNLVFLIDVSGSMNEPAKLPLVKEGLKLMVNELTENDRISIVVYAGNAGVVLPSTTADPKNKQAILTAIDNLSAGGSTNGGQGIQLAYKLATDNFIKGGTNRVLLATDGDWNVGITDQSSLTQLIQDKAKSGVFLSVLGYGFGNLKDATMEKLADKGNGHYAYIDNLKESKKVLVEEMSSTLVTIAKDVKIQVEFNPSKVESYRLIGYEKRLLRKEDFNNDKVDAGEIGAGHAVTALYEIAPLIDRAKDAQPATKPQGDDVDSLKYQKHEVVKSDDLMTVKLRYKQPDGDQSAKLEFPAVDKGLTYSKASEDFKFSAAVAQFGMILRNSPHKGTASLDGVLELAAEGKGKDANGYRSEFLEMVNKAKALNK
jgi:Ca-activated chloride channel family protein